MPANNPKAAENLKPFKKGPDERRAGNGRKPKLPEIDALLAEILGEEKDGITAAQAILAALRSKATKGDIRAAEVLMDRAYGKAKQQMDVTTNGETMNGVPTVNVYNCAPPLASTEDTVDGDV